MDLEAIKSRLNAMQKTTNGKGGGERASMFWKPTVGKQTVRVVPSKYNPTMPFSEIFFHYGIDKPVMVSPINWGDKDPIVEFAAQLKKTNDKENWKLAKKIEPKARYFAPVIVRGEEDKGVRLWQFSKEIYEHQFHSLHLTSGKHLDRKSTRLNSSHSAKSRMPSSA